MFSCIKKTDEERERERDVLIEEYYYAKVNHVRV